MSTQLSRSAAVCFAVMFVFTLWAPTIAPVEPASIASAALPVLA